MHPIFFWILNVLLIGGALHLFFKRDLLTQFRRGQWWLTWLAIGVITLMDELTSIFYAPAEAYRYIGLAAIVFIPVTAIFIHYMTTRMVEIAEILDSNQLKGGGVYNFSYLVLGPLVSFAAVASIMVTYMLTASISAVSAVENANFFFSLSGPHKIYIEFLIVWLVAGLNILGIRDNARITFGIFLFTAVVLLNLVFSGLFQMDASQWWQIKAASAQSLDQMTSGGFFHGYFFIIAAASNCILAYSGVESVLQTASLVRSWKVISRAYLFLALTVGLFTPLLSVVVLSSPGLDIKGHETDLITHFATVINGPIFGILVAIVASVTLLMAVNTAFVASSELLEQVGLRYGFKWIIQTNKRDSLYRIHLANAVFFSVIILLTQGQQKSLAEMYAVGLVATFVINLLCLLIYRYFKGSEEGERQFHASRTGTLIFFLVILSCFIYLSFHKPAGFLLWASVTGLSLLIGIYGTRKRAPELIEIERGEIPMDLVFYIAEAKEHNVHVHFKRPMEAEQKKPYDVSASVTFYSPRRKIPSRLEPNHFRLPITHGGIFENIVAVLDLLVYELPGKNITVHLGWPTSSWFDRLSIGVMFYQFIRLPTVFPQINFRIDRFKLKKK